MPTDEATPLSQIVIDSPHQCPPIADDELVEEGDDADDDRPEATV